jgi:hypothetical protein
MRTSTINKQYFGLFIAKICDNVSFITGDGKSFTLFLTRTYLEALLAFYQNTAGSFERPNNTNDTHIHFATGTRSTTVL